MTIAQRRHRLLVHCYEHYVNEANKRKCFLLRHLETMDALKDVVTGNKEAMSEWTINEDGDITFK